MANEEIKSFWTLFKKRIIVSWEKFNLNNKLNLKLQKQNNPTLDYQIQEISTKYFRK